MSEERKDRGKLYSIFVLAAAVILLATDQITKYYVLRYLKPVESVTVIDGLLELAYVENTGVAFGLLQDRLWLVLVITAVAFTLILWLLFRYRYHTFFSYGSVALLLAGGAGNLIDRLSYSFVVDFIHVLFFDYIFNFADCCITVGAALLLCHTLVITHREKREAAQKNGCKG